MMISVFGLGYVGSVTAASFAARGHSVVGVDVNPSKVDALSRGEPPVLEPGLGELTAAAVRSGTLRATADVADAVRSSEVILVCVGTPSAPDGGLSTEALERVCRDVGEQLAGAGRRMTVVFRSTVLPGTSEQVLIPILEQSSGLRAADDFGVCVNPEYLREGSGVRDFMEPAKTVIGEIDPASGDTLSTLYEDFPGTLFRVPLKSAELAKYVDNAFHALKVGFANEIGAISGDLGIDSHRVMEIFRSDTKLNISETYLTPGFSFGGSCLPKDLRALMHHARGAHVSVPILDSVLASNEAHFQRALQLIAQSGIRRVGLLGLAFKPNTDELRESPFVELSERLIGKGYDLRIYDPAVRLSRLTGANRAYVETHLPHIRELLTESAREAVEHAELCVVASKDASVVEALSDSDGKVIVDLVRLPDLPDLRRRTSYHGVAW